MGGRPRQLARALRDQVYYRFNGCCLGCGSVLFKADGWNVHHVVPRSEGGTDDLDNLAALCLDCHTRAEDMQPAPPSLIGLRNALRYVAETVATVQKFVGTPERVESCEDWPILDWRKWVYGGYDSPFVDSRFIRHRVNCARCAAA